MTRKRACDVCYRKKIQCTVLRPEDPCEWCGQHDLACTFTRNTQSKKTRNRLKYGDVQALLSRVQHLEGALAQSQQLAHAASPSTEQQRSPQSASSPDSPSDGPQPTPSSMQVSPPASHPVVCPSEQGTFSGGDLGQNWYCKGIPIFSEKGQQWISSKTGEDVDFRRFRLFCRQPVVLPPTLQPDASQKLWELPSRTVVQEVVDIYFTSSIQLVFPVLDRVLFEETVDIAFQPADGIPSSQPQALARACVLAALSVAYRLEGVGEVLYGVDGDIWASRTQLLLSYITEYAEVASLQTILMLQRHEMLSSRTQKANSLHAVACRMVCTLGGHMYRPQKPYESEISLDERRDHHVRTLFWLCYDLDKNISLRSGQPPLLTREYCDLTPPANYWGYYDRLPEWTTNTARDGLPPRVPCDTQLCCLKEDIYRLLFSPQAFSITDGILLLRIRQLDNELESWRLSIPSEFRPQLSIPANHPLFAAKTNILHNLRCIHLQLEYHYLTTVIHTTVRRCRAGGTDASTLPEDLHNVVHSSYDLSLEASRSVLDFLRMSQDSLAEQEFSQVVFYAIVAVMPLFIDILVHPLGPESEGRIDLLVSSISVIQGIPMSRPTRSDIKHMKGITDLVVELVHLGRCAISKVKQPTREPRS